MRLSLAITLAALAACAAPPPAPPPAAEIQIWRETDDGFPGDPIVHEVVASFTSWEACIAALPGTLRGPDQSVGCVAVRRN